MTRLDAPDEFVQAEAAFRQVFERAEAAAPFGARHPARLLLYPIDYTLLTPAQLAAVAAAASETRALLAGQGLEEEGWGGTYGHRVVDLGRYEDYKHPGEPNLEHFLYSPAAEWGVATSDGEYAVVGGDAGFVDAVRASLDYDEEQAVEAFVRDWRDIQRDGEPALEWVPRLLAHVFGEERARALWPA